MTTRTELIVRLRDFDNRCDDDVAGDVDLAADMLEADIGKDSYHAVFGHLGMTPDELGNRYNALQAAARLALEALLWCGPHEPGEMEDDAICALRRVLE